jgi:hypothetical protein
MSQPRIEPGSPTSQASTLAKGFSNSYATSTVLMIQAFAIHGLAVSTWSLHPCAGDSAFTRDNQLRIKGKNT